MSAASCLVLVVRGRKNWESLVNKDLYKRRLEDGPEPLRPRSAIFEWNYPMELKAFNNRFGETVRIDTLEAAFNNIPQVSALSSGDQEESAVSRTLNNEELSKIGLSVCERCLNELTRQAYPHLPAEGVRSIKDFLLSDAIVLHVANNLGLRDLIVCEEIPPSDVTTRSTFFAVVGAIHHDTSEGLAQGETRAGLFVRDFLFTQLLDKDINNILTFDNPMSLLTEILTKSGKGEPEARLLREFGSATVEAVYEVGIYSDKNLIGQSPGETPLIAEEMAAKNALSNFFMTRSYHMDIDFANLNPIAKSS